MAEEVKHDDGQVIEVDITPKWEDLMPRFLQILARKPLCNGDQELLDLVKAECMRAAIQMDRIGNGLNDEMDDTIIYQPAEELTSACSTDEVVE